METYTTATNKYMYEKQITRVRDVYGNYFWVSTRHLDDNKTLLPICTPYGLRRSYSQAGQDGQNTLHKDNIQLVKQTRTFAEPAPLEMKQERMF